MIAAATGALVSEIVLDETVLLNFKQHKFSITIKFFLYPSRNFDWFYVGILYPLLSKNRTLFCKLKLNAYKKALLGASIFVLILYFRHFW
jgi:CIC family chloride channel protein